MLEGLPEGLQDLLDQEGLLLLHLLLHLHLWEDHRHLADHLHQ
jgi:hypothetical protein